MTWYITTSILSTVYCFLLAVKKFHGCKSFPSFPQKYSRFQNILPIMAKFEHSKLKFRLKLSRSRSNPRKLRNFFTANKKQYTVFNITTPIFSTQYHNSHVPMLDIEYYNLIIPIINILNITTAILSTQYHNSDVPILDIE